MKKTSLFSLVLVFAFAVSSCIPDFGISNSVSDKNSSDYSEPDVSQTDSEISNELSDEVSEDILSSMTPDELVNYASEHNLTLDSYVYDYEQTIIYDISGSQQSTTYNYIEKAKDVNGDNPAISLSFSGGEYKDNYYYSNGKGYYNSNNSRYSFDCSAEEFIEYTNLVIWQDFEQDDNTDFMNSVLSNGNITVLENGNYFITFENNIDFDLFSEYIGFDNVSKETPVTTKYEVTVNADGYMISERMDMKFALSAPTGEVPMSAYFSTTVSNLNGEVNIMFIDTNYTHLGLIDLMYAALGYDYLSVSDQYSVDSTITTTVNGIGLNDNVVVKNSFDYLTKNSPRFAYDFNFNYNGSSVGYRYYMQDEVIYIKVGEEVTETEFPATESNVFDIWCFSEIDFSSGKDFTYSDNGDGTGTLKYSFTDAFVAKNADNYILDIYGEEYYGIFQNADSMTVNSAVVSVVVDTETHRIISHDYNIDVTFVLDGERVTYKEGCNSVFGYENIIVPEKNVFLGSSEV